MQSVLRPGREETVPEMRLVGVQRVCSGFGCLLRGFNLTFKGTKMKTYEPMCGVNISQVCKEITDLVAETGEPVTSDFNGISIVAEVGVTAGDLEQKWREESDRRHKEYVSSPEYKQRQVEAKAKCAAALQRLERGLADAPTMELADEQKWIKFAASNTDPYGGRVVKYAKDWARLMQSRMADGDSLEACAEETSRIADNDGITGFMYGAAVSVLAQTWKHGESLRRWHNKETQFGDEGDKANESGGVLNPAILGVKV